MSSTGYGVSNYKFNRTSWTSDTSNPASLEDDSNLLFIYDNNLHLLFIPESTALSSSSIYRLKNSMWTKCEAFDDKPVTTY